MARNQVYVDDEAGALAGSNSEKLFSIPYQCPYASSDKACGSWCSLFELSETQTGVSGEIKFHQDIGLRCGDGKKRFVFASDSSVNE